MHSLLTLVKCIIQLSMLGHVPDAIKEWRNRRTQGTSRLDSLLFDDVMEGAELALVGMPEDEDGLMMGSYSSSHARQYNGVHGNDDDTEEEVTRQVECMKLPKGMEKHMKLGPLLDSLEPCLSGVDSRIGLRQMHLALTCNCTCAKSSVYPSPSL